MAEARAILVIIDVLFEDRFIADGHLKLDPGLICRKDLITARRREILPLDFEASGSRRLRSLDGVRQGVAAHFGNPGHGGDRRRDTVVPPVRAVLPEMTNAARA